MSIFKSNIAFRTLRSQTFQWEKKRPQAAKIGTQIVTDSLKRRCIATPGTSSGSENSSSTQSGQLPGIDIFLNPEKKDGKDQIVAQKQKVAAVNSSRVKFISFCDSCISYGLRQNVFWTKFSFIFDNCGIDIVITFGLKKSN